MYMRKEQFHITGMTCSACSSRVEGCVVKLPGVKDVSVNLLKNSMVVSYDESEMNTARNVEQKTGKRRIFTVPLLIQQYIENYCLRNSIRRTERIFPITERAVQKQLAIVCDYLGLDGISTHSFRKWYATEIYKTNGYDIALVQRLLQHSSAATTQRYIGIEPQRIEQAIQNHAQLI